MEGLENLMQNKMFLQYLAAAGQDIGAGQPIGANVNKVTMQNIAAQNYMKLLQQMLGPDDTKGAISKDGIKMDIPASALGTLSGGSMFTPDQSLAPIKQPGGMANPFVSSQPSISGADLAGLTPQDISSALSGAQSVEALRQKKVSDVSDTLYKQKMMDYYDALIGEKTPSITIPGTDIKLTTKQYLDWYKSANKDERTNAIKNYEYAQTEAGGSFKGSFEEYQNSAWTGHKKDYEEAVAGGYRGPNDTEPDFNTWLRDITALGGGLTLGEKLTEIKAKAGLKGQTYFKDPKWTEDLNKYMSSDEVQNELFKMETGEQEQKTSEVKVQFIEDKITAGGGKVEGVKFAEDNKTMIWTVKWPSGDIEEIRYAVRS